MYFTFSAIQDTSWISSVIGHGPSPSAWPEPIVILLYTNLAPFPRSFGRVPVYYWQLVTVNQIVTWLLRNKGRLSRRCYYWTRQKVVLLEMLGIGYTLIWMEPLSWGTQAKIEHYISVSVSLCFKTFKLLNEKYLKITYFGKLLCVFYSFVLSFHLWYILFILCFVQQ